MKKPHWNSVLGLLGTIIDQHHQGHGLNTQKEDMAALITKLRALQNNEPLMMALRLMGDDPATWGPGLYDLLDCLLHSRPPILGSYLSPGWVWDYAVTLGLWPGISPRRVLYRPADCVRKP
jgi:hypothetical protein